MGFVGNTEFGIGDNDEEGGESWDKGRNKVALSQSATLYRLSHPLFPRYFTGPLERRMTSSTHSVRCTGSFLLAWICSNNVVTPAWPSWTSGWRSVVIGGERCA